MRATPRALVHALYLGLSLLFASRVFALTNFTGHAMTDGDPALMAWTLQWESRALVRNPLELYAGNAFYPYPRSIVLSEPIVPLAVLNVPVRAFSANPWVGYNLLIVAAFYLSCVWGAAFVRAITGSDVAGVWGGIFWAFLFFRVHHIGHLQILSFQWVPAAMLCLVQLWRGPRVGRALLFVLAFVSQALVSWYLAVIVTVVLVVILLFRPRAEILSPPIVRLYALMALVTAVVILPFALPYRAGLADSTLAGRRLAIDTSGDAVRLRDYLTPPQATLPGRLVPGNPYTIWGENTLYIGVVPLALAAIAVGAAVRRPPSRLWRFGAPRRRSPASPASEGWRWTLTGLALMAVGYILALGFVSPGWGIRLPLNYAAHALPMLGALRATQRFSLVLYAGVLVLSALGLAHVISGRSRRWQIATTIVVCAVFLLEVFPFTLPLDPARPYAPSAPDRFIAQYQKTRPPPLIVLHLPIYYFSEPYPISEATYMVDSTWHWARILNGFSGAEPAGFMERMRILNTLPAAPAIQLVRDLGVDVIAVHGRAARSDTGVRDFFSRQEWSSVVPFPTGEFVVLIER